MIARVAGDRARELGRVALRLAGAGVVGTGIGAAAKRWSPADLPDLTNVPVWETARRAVAMVPAVKVPALPPEMVPVLALFGLAFGLATVAAYLWTRTSSAVDGASATPRALDLPALTALFRRPAQRRAAPQRALLVPSLAATGVDRAEIARRTGLSRDAVALSLSLAARQG